MSAPTTAPKHVAVVGAGMVGLATAWYLQEHGAEVTVIDRTGVAAGSSWGNAGWLTPGITTPLPEPAVLRYGLRAVLSPSSPVYVPPKADPALLRFVAGFTRNATARAWRRNMGALVPINGLALDAFDELAAGGVSEPTREAASFIAAYRTERERATLLEELEHIASAGQAMRFEVLTGAEARSLEPVLSEQIGAAIVLKDQRFIDPGAYAAALADSFVARGGRLLTGMELMGLDDLGTSVLLHGTRGWSGSFDSVVLATGAWLGEHARRFGVRQVVQAGRGYSFSVKADDLPAGPVYLPAARVACTPIGQRLRVAGMMEFRRPDEALDQRRIRAIVEAARPLLRGVDLQAREDEWVGSRPCTIDGLPLIGATRSPRVHVAGGHSMWGITLGPVTGKLLAEQIATGVRLEPLAPFDPLR
ncbi:MAG TPA: FAD-dependent oxidoreductase [Dermatophilaceae bacterium]|nr:FAD-dependent oxidoreductase [Dermatophilaceae bacterium]